MPFEYCFSILSLWYEVMIWRSLLLLHYSAQDITENKSCIIGLELFILSLFVCLLVLFLNRIFCGGNRLNFCTLLWFIWRLLVKIGHTDALNNGMVNYCSVA